METPKNIVNNFHIMSCSSEQPRRSVQIDEGIWTHPDTRSSGYGSSPDPQYSGSFVQCVRQWPGMPSELANSEHIHLTECNGNELDMDMIEDIDFLDDLPTDNTNECLLNESEYMKEFMNKGQTLEQSELMRLDVTVTDLSNFTPDCSGLPVWMNDCISSFCGGEIDELLNNTDLNDSIFQKSVVEQKKTVPLLPDVKVEFNSTPPSCQFDNDQLIYGSTKTEPSAHVTENKASDDVFTEPSNEFLNPIASPQTRLKTGSEILRSKSKVPSSTTVMLQKSSPAYQSDLLIKDEKVEPQKKSSTSNTESSLSSDSDQKSLDTLDGSGQGTSESSGRKMTSLLSLIVKETPAVFKKTKRDHSRTTEYMAGSTYSVGDTWTKSSAGLRDKCRNMKHVTSYQLRDPWAESKGGCKNHDIGDSRGSDPCSSSLHSKSTDEEASAGKNTKPDDEQASSLENKSVGSSYENMWSRRSLKYESEHVLRTAKVQTENPKSKMLPKFPLKKYDTSKIPLNVKPKPTLLTKPSTTMYDMLTSTDMSHVKIPYKSIPLDLRSNQPAFTPSKTGEPPAFIKAEDKWCESIKNLDKMDCWSKLSNPNLTSKDQSKKRTHSDSDSEMKAKKCSKPSYRFGTYSGILLNKQAENYPSDSKLDRNDLDLMSDIDKDMMRKRLNRFESTKENLEKAGLLTVASRLNGFMQSNELLQKEIKKVKLASQLLLCQILNNPENANAKEMLLEKKKLREMSMAVTTVK